MHRDLRYVCTAVARRVLSYLHSCGLDQKLKPSRYFKILPESMVYIVKLYNMSYYIINGPFTSI